MQVDVEDYVEELPTPNVNTTMQELHNKLNQTKEENEVVLREMEANRTNVCMVFTTCGATVVMTLSVHDFF